MPTSDHLQEVDRRAVTVLGRDEERAVTGEGVLTGKHAAPHQGRGRTRVPGRSPRRTPPEACTSARCFGDGIHAAVAATCTPAESSPLAGDHPADVPLQQREAACRAAAVRPGDRRRDAVLLVAERRGRQQERGAHHGAEVEVLVATERVVALHLDVATAPHLDPAADRRGHRAVGDAEIVELHLRGEVVAPQLRHQRRRARSRASASGARAPLRRGRGRSAAAACRSPARCRHGSAAPFASACRR